MEYAGIQHKELAAKADIKPRALLTYVAANPSMPPADVAVRLARALGVTVEYLVDGMDRQSAEGNGRDGGMGTVVRGGGRLPLRDRNLVDNFDRLSEREKAAVETMVALLAGTPG